MRCFSILLFLICPAIVLAQTGPTSALISQALDQPVKLELNTTLPLAMKAITDQTGVRVEADRAVWDLLPWGDQTNVTANVDNTTLRVALDAIARKLGLKAVLTEQSIELRPLPPLLRLGRRATQEELQVLDFLSATPFTATAETNKVKGMLSMIDHQLEESQSLEKSKSGFAIENRLGIEINDRPISIRRGSTIMDALQALSAQTEATWYPSGKTVLIVSKEEQMRNQLAKRITRSYPGVPVGQVLADLSQLSGVDFTIEPGAIQRIAPEFRNIKLLMDNAPVEQALAHISAFTGLGYVVNERGVYLWAASTGTPTTTGRDPIVALVEVSPGIQVILPQSQVTPAVREQLRTLTQRKLRELEHQPTSGPTTQDQP
jgi:hypothetical protein